MKNEALRTVKNDHRGRQLIESARLRLPFAFESVAHGFDFGHIHGHPNGGHASWRINDVEHPPLTDDDRRSAPAPDRAGVARFGAGVARRAFEKLDAARNSGGLILGFDGAGVGRIDPGQSAFAIAHPSRIWNRIEHRP